MCLPVRRRLEKNNKEQTKQENNDDSVAAMALTEQHISETRATSKQTPFHFAHKMKLQRIA